MDIYEKNSCPGAKYQPFLKKPQARSGPASPNCRKSIPYAGFRLTCVDFVNRYGNDVATKKQSCRRLTLTVLAPVSLSATIGHCYFLASDRHAALRIDADMFRRFCRAAKITE
jgi:hypothetical protein